MIIRSFILALVIADVHVLADVTSYGNRTIVRPFGSMAPRRPPVGARVVELPNLNLSFEAQQICGYTDWSTAVINLPKEILTAEYWSSIGKNLKTKAIESISAIAGALPSMLSCNISPTYCHIMNRAEALAQANLKFTFDSCQILEGVADKTRTSSSALGSCVKNKTHGSGAVSSGKAIDQCALGQSQGANTEDSVRNAAGSASDTHKAEDLTAKACKETTDEKYRNSVHAYSLTKQSCDWMKEFFPGITVAAGATFKQGGTFTLSGSELLYEKKIDAGKSYLVEMLDLMHSIRFGKGNYASTGPLPRHLVVSHRDVSAQLGIKPDGKIRGICYPEDGDSCTTDVSRLPPVYRFSSVGGLPTLLVTPETLMELVEAIPADQKPSREYERSGSRLAVILEPLVQSLAYATTQDVVKDSLLRLNDACQDPGMENAGAQRDCTQRLAKLKEEQDAMRIRDESDRKHLMAQAQFYAEVDRFKSLQLRSRPDLSSPGKDAVKSPQEL